MEKSIEQNGRVFEINEDGTKGWFFWDTDAVSTCGPYDSEELATAAMHDMDRERLIEDIPNMSWEELLSEISKWQRRTFPDTTPESARKHLEREVTEEIKREPWDIIEWSDALFLVLQGAELIREVTGETLLNATKQKFAINLKREWHKADDDGVYLHSKEAPAPDVVDIRVHRGRVIP